MRPLTQAWARLGAAGTKAMWIGQYARSARAGNIGGRIERGAHIGGPGTLTLGRAAIIQSGARIYIGPGARLELGPGSSLGDRAIVNCVAGITIGSGTRISWNVQILDTDFHPIRRPDGTLTEQDAPVRIGSEVLIATGAMILKGVTIGDGAVVGAGAVVTRDVEPGTIVAGNPAVVVGRGSAVL